MASWQQCELMAIWQQCEAAGHGPSELSSCENGEQRQLALALLNDEMWEANLLEPDGIRVIRQGLGRARRRPGRVRDVGGEAGARRHQPRHWPRKAQAWPPLARRCYLSFFKQLCCYLAAILQLCGDVSERAPDLEGGEGPITGGRREVWVRPSKARERMNTYPALLTLLLPRPHSSERGGRRAKRTGSVVILAAFFPPRFSCRRSGGAWGGMRGGVGWGDLRELCEHDFSGSHLMVVSTSRCRA